MQLQNARQRFEGQGIKLAAISYDSPAILKDFADRHGIDYPLLADPQSKIIASYGVLNPEATDMMKGMAEAPHLNLELGQSDRVVAPGSRFSLVAQVELPRDVHVYAPDVKGYKPTQLELAPSPDVELLPPVYPPSKVLYLQAIKEQVPVFEGKFRITSEVKTSANADFVKSLGPSGKTITIAGKLHYQACDKTTCFLPTSVPVAWQLRILPLDRQRSPEAIQHK